MTRARARREAGELGSYRKFVTLFGHLPYSILCRSVHRYFTSYETSPDRETFFGGVSLPKYFPFLDQSWVASATPGFRAYQPISLRRSGAPVRVSQPYVSFDLFSFLTNIQVRHLTSLSNHSFYRAGALLHHLVFVFFFFQSPLIWYLGLWICFFLSRLALSS